MKKHLPEDLDLNQIQARKILLKSEIDSLEKQIMETIRQSSARLNPFARSKPMLSPTAKAMIAFESIMEGIALCRKIRSLFQSGNRF